MVYNIKKSEELFKLKLSVVCAHGIETHSVNIDTAAARSIYRGAVNLFLFDTALLNSSESVISET